MPLALVDHITPRLSYITEFLFGEVLGLPIRLTDDRSVWVHSDGPKFCYCRETASDSLAFHPAGLLSETGLHLNPVQHLRYHDLSVLFPVREGGALPFDPFAMAFFILSRMEEHLPFDADEHGRFTHMNSLQHALDLLHEPVVNRLAFIVLEKLQEKFPQLTPRVSYSFLPTVDVDIAFAHLGKDPLRAAGGFAKLLLKGDVNNAKERLATLRGRKKDPYDNFDLHLELAARYGTGLIYFWLLGDYGRNDKMLSHTNRQFRDLIRNVSDRADCGIHPSYASFGAPSRVGKEIGRLEAITGKKVTTHRAHFLRLRFPDTFRDLIRLGITDDYSLGYSEVNGFRAGTSTPFFFFDILKDEKTSLRLHPFITMDSAFIDHLGMDPRDAFSEAVTLAGKVRQFGGEAIGIWHNYSLCEKGRYRGWQQFFRDFMDVATK